jgi:hypothetical protein
MGSGDGLRLEALICEEPGRRQLLAAPVQASSAGHATARPSTWARTRSGCGASVRSRSATGTAEITASLLYECRQRISSILRSSSHGESTRSRTTSRSMSDSGCASPRAHEPKRKDDAAAHRTVRVDPRPQRWRSRLDRRPRRAPNAPGPPSPRVRVPRRRLRSVHDLPATQSPDVPCGRPGTQTRPDAGPGRVVLQRFRQRPEVQALQIEHLYLLHPLDGVDLPGDGP